MEIIYEAYQIFQKKGYVDLNHVIAISNDLDKVDIFHFYEKEKNNKDITKFMDLFQKYYSKNSTISDGINHNYGHISNDDCIICLDENVVGYMFDCNHFTCISCYLKLFKNTNTKNCPYCRKIVMKDKRLNDRFFNLKRNPVVIDVIEIIDSDDDM